MKSLCQLVLGISKVYVIFKKYILYPGYTLFQNAESRSKSTHSKSGLQSNRNKCYLCWSRFPKCYLILWDLTLHTDQDNFNIPCYWTKLYTDFLLTQGLWPPFSQRGYLLTLENLPLLKLFWPFSSIQFSSAAQSCMTIWDPMNQITPGLPVHHQLLESAQTHVHRVGDAIKPSYSLSSPSPPAPNPSHYQGLFQWVNFSHEVAKVLEFQLQHQSFQWTPRTNL